MDVENAFKILLEKPGYRNEFECKKAVPFLMGQVGILKKVKPGKLRKINDKKRKQQQ